MKIQYASDLHLEFGTPYKVFKEYSGDILILAGDIITYKLQGLDTLKQICKNYNHVIMILGNHEHYSGYFNKTYNKLKDNLPNNVHLLENEILEIDGKRFLGCTLWSYMNEIDSYFASVRMNDYRSVRIGPNTKPWLRKLSPRDTIAEHMKSALWLEENIRENDIVITHHAPSFKSCNPNYEGNTAYATDLSDIMFDTNPSHWIHGHLHEAVEYEIGNTIVTSNPYGYFAHENTSNFKMKEIEC